jgi:hypothetical protein
VCTYACTILQTADGDKYIGTYDRLLPSGQCDDYVQDTVDRTGAVDTHWTVDRQE